MRSLTYRQAQELYDDFPTTFKRQEARVGNLNLVLFDYYYANWQVFRDHPLSRNLRGVIFDMDSKELVSLPFHKFFNVNENDLTQEENLTFDGVMYDKQDGSMAQISLYNGELVIASRSSLNGYVHDGVHKLMPQYAELADYIRKHPAHTFLFEFLDTEHSIVLRHAKPELVFLNARDKQTGDYVGDRHRSEIPCRVTPAQEIHHDMWPRVKEGMESTKEFEGYVIWLNHHQEFYKQKTAWYVASHRLVTEQSPKGFIEAWATDTLDDLAASLMSLGHGDVLKEISVYVNTAEALVSSKLNHLLEVIDGKDTAKEMAIAMNSGHVNDDIDQMLFGAIMAIFNSGEELTFGEIFNNFRSNLAGSDVRLKRVVDGVDRVLTTKAE